MTPPILICPAVPEENYSDQGPVCAPGPVCSPPQVMVIEDETRGLSYVGIGQTCIEELHRITPPNYYRSLLRRLHRSNVPGSPQSQTQPPAQSPSRPFRPQGAGLTTPSIAPSNVDSRSAMERISDFYTFAIGNAPLTDPRMGGVALLTTIVLPPAASLVGAGALGLAAALFR